MAFLILTRAGFDVLISQFGRLPPNVWVGLNVLSADELENYRAGGEPITNFTVDIPLDDRVAINSALDTVADHHPDEPVYAEWTDC